MADKRQAAAAAAEERPGKHAAEPAYTAAEFAAHPERFGPAVTPDCVRAAFALAGRGSATKTEAERLVSAFLKKEVK